MRKTTIMCCFEVQWTVRVFFFGALKRSTIKCQMCVCVCTFFIFGLKYTLCACVCFEANKMHTEDPITEKFMHPHKTTSKKMPTSIDRFLPYQRYVSKIYETIWINLRRGNRPQCVGNMDIVGHCTFYRSKKEVT